MSGVCQVSFVICQVSGVRCQVSGVRCQVSQYIYIYIIIYFLDKEVEPVGGGSVINGA